MTVNADLHLATFQGACAHGITSYAQCKRCPVAKRPYLREWREKAGLTLADLAGRLAFMDDDKLPKTAASLSRVEGGGQPYSERLLNALASIYEIDVDRLFIENPTKAGQVVFFEGATTTDIDELRAIFEALQEKRKA